LRVSAVHHGITESAKGTRRFTHQHLLPDLLRQRDETNGCVATESSAASVFPW
jgi:hypothetical protein